MMLKRITVDLENPGSTPIIFAVQSSCSLGLEIKLRRNQRPCRIAKDIRTVVRYKKLDGKGGEYDTLGDSTPAGTVSGDCLTVHLSSQMFTMPGSVEVTVALHQGSTVIGCIPVVLYVGGSANAALPDSGEHMSDPAGGWPAPETAKAGQFLRVSAVDAAGKVTALDTSEAGGFPDWNQNDETQSDYIRNRPFYVITEETDTVGWNDRCETLTLPDGSLSLLRLPADVGMEDLLGGLTLRLITDTGEVIEHSDFEGPYSGSTICEPIDDVVSVFYLFENIMGFYISQDGYPVAGIEPPMVIPRAGLWLYSAYEELLPGCKQFLIFRRGPVRAEKVVPLSHRFIPELPYIPKSKESHFVTEEDIVGRRIDNGGELFNTASSASGEDAHAEGCQTSANGSYSHAEGYQTVAYATYSHAEGYCTEANSGSHAEGYLSKAHGLYAHAEGFNTEVRAIATHAEGYESEAHGHYSHAEGYGTLANGDSQHTQGRFNIVDSESKYAHIVGNGSDNENRSNAHTLDWEGNGWFAGRLKVGGTGQEDPLAQEIPTRAEVLEMIQAAGGNSSPETQMVLSDNLLDLSLLTRGKCFYYGSSGFSLVDSADSYYGFIPLRGSGAYRTKFQASIHSSTNKRIVLVNDSNEWVATVTGSHGEVPADDTRNWLDYEFVVTQAHIDAGATKVAFDAWVLYLDKTMLVKDREYPSKFIPYGYIEVATDSGMKQNNVLLEKTAIFLGDSICAGTTVGTDSPYYGYGWGGIIGEANRMTWKNYGKNGGTITHRGSDNTCIAKIADTAITEYPAADYVIFEGGCNDADQMKEAGLGEISADYANFDTTTFSGALEALILKLITAYPYARIGYIIPQKMYTGYADYTADTHIHRKYFERAISICNKWGIPCLDLWTGCPLNPKLSTASIFYVEQNGQHLTEAGYQAVTPKIEAFMRSL